MDEALRAKDSGLSDRSLAIALITVARYMAERDPDFYLYLGGSLDNATKAGLLSSDTALMKLILHSIGG